MRGRPRPFGPFGPFGQSRAVRADPGPIGFGGLAQKDEPLIGFVNVGMFCPDGRVSGLSKPMARV